MTKTKAKTKAKPKTKAKMKAEGARPAPKRRPRDMEVEVKLRCDDLSRLTGAGLDVEEAEPRHFEDNWVFRLPDGKLRKGQYLRVRYVGDGDGDGRRREGLMTYKGKSQREGEHKGKKGKKKVREEIESTVGQPNQVVKIFKRLGLKRSFRYQKYRTSFAVRLEDGRRLTATYDETPLGNFIELEGDAETIETVAATLGYTPDAYLDESYIEMQLARCAARGEPLADMLFSEAEIERAEAGESPTTPAKRRRAPATPKEKAGPKRSSTAGKGRKKGA